MVQEGIYCNLIWDDIYKNYIGVFTIRDLLRLFINTYERIFDEKLFKVTNPKDLAKSILSQSKPCVYPRRYQSDDLSAITESDNESNSMISCDLVTPLIINNTIESTSAER